MFSELIDILTLLATLPNRGVVLTEAAFVLVAFLFVLELAAPPIILVGLILKASALPQARLRAGRAPPRPPGHRQTPAPIATATTPVRLGADEAKPLFGEIEPGGETPSQPHSIEGLARVISEAQSGLKGNDREASG